jgi:hypothetical protein
VASRNDGLEESVFWSSPEAYVPYDGADFNVLPNQSGSIEVRWVLEFDQEVTFTAQTGDFDISVDGYILAAGT